MESSLNCTMANNKPLALVTGQLSNEIMEIMEDIGKLFGVLNEDVVKL